MLRNTLSLRAVSCAQIAAVLLTASAALGSNLVTDPGFENNPVTTAANSLSNFPGFQGVWGQENSTILSVDGSISPYAGQLQLRMDVTGGVTTQAFQAIDVSSYAATIDANTAQLTSSAYFNTNVPGAFCGVYVSYFTGNTYGTLFGPLDQANLALDGSPATWELVTQTTMIPAGTRWIIFQVAFAESTLQGVGFIGSGYVDEAFAEIRTVPTPGAAAMLGLGGLIATRRRRA